MSAVTPNAKHRQGLPDLKPRFVKLDTLPWESTKFPGVETKTLLVDKSTGLLTVLLRMAPGARCPITSMSRSSRPMCSRDGWSIPMANAAPASSSGVRRVVGTRPGPRTAA